MMDKLIIGVVLIFSELAYAQTSEQEGRLIYEESIRRSAGFVDMVVSFKMILFSRQGDQKSERELQFKTLEGGERKPNKSLMIFEGSPFYDGTALLSVMNKQDRGVHWLYLPALNRANKLTSNFSSWPFMGSEFSFEDLIVPSINQYHYHYMRDDAWNDLDCFVIESYPVDTQTSYTRIVSWIDKAEYRVLKADYYDRKNELLKTKTMEDYQQYADKYWRPAKYTMVNVQTGKKTVMVATQYRFNQGLTDNDFQLYAKR